MRRCQENALDIRLHTDMNQESGDRETWSQDVANCTYLLLQPCMHALRSKVFRMPAQGLRKMGIRVAYPHGGQTLCESFIFPKEYCE
jgi:hypothetical protein